MALGYGTQAYLDINRYLIALFAILVVLALPSMYLFASYKNGNR